MARREAIEYFKFHRKIFCEDFLKRIPKNTISYQATLKEKEFYDMAIKSLETMEEFENAQILVGGRLNGRTYAYKCGLEDGERKALDERKKGKWVFVGDNCFKCSECGEVYTLNQFRLINNYNDNRFPKGCPNCATEMW